MRLNIKHTNLELTPEVSDYLSKKLAAIEKLIDPNDTSVMCDVELARTTAHHNRGDIFRAEIHLHVSGKYLNTFAEKENIFAAIDDAKDEMTRSLKGYKTKRLTLLKKGSAQIKAMLRGWFKRK